MKFKDILIEQKSNSDFEKFCATRLKGAEKITNSAKEKGGPSMLTYHHFRVKLPYYKESSEGKFNMESYKKEFKDNLDKLCKLTDDVNMNQVEFQKLVGLIEVLGELIIKKNG